jgi:hypothetical protein
MIANLLDGSLRVRQKQLIVLVENIGNAFFPTGSTSRRIESEIRGFWNTYMGTSGKRNLG